DYGTGSPIPGLLLGLLHSVGLPFFAVSTSAPLLQKWFAGTNHPQAQDPYFLYAASNLGSMVGLNGYLAGIEPWLTLANHRHYWQVGFGLVVVRTAVGAVCLWRSQRGTRGEGRWTREEQSSLASCPSSQIGTRDERRGTTEEPSFLAPRPSSLAPLQRLR